MKDKAGNPIVPLPEKKFITVQCSPGISRIRCMQTHDSCRHQHELSLSHEEQRIYDMVRAVLQICQRADQLTAPMYRFELMQRNDIVCTQTAAL